jgi:hypothetical protein
MLSSGIGRYAALQTKWVSIVVGVLCYRFEGHGFKD